MRELKLQQLRLARRQAQQDRKDLQMDHFFQQLDEIEKSPILLNQENLEALKQEAEITLEFNGKTESKPNKETVEPTKDGETTKEMKQENSISSETKIEKEINTEVNTSHPYKNELNETTQEITKISEVEMKVENGDQRLESEISPARNNLELSEETRTKHEVITIKSNQIQTENNKINHEATHVLGPETGAISKQRRPPSLETDIEPSAEQNTEVRITSIY